MSAPPGQVRPGKASEKPKPKRRNNRELGRAVAVLVLAGIAIAFAAVNSRSVQVDWIFGSDHAPLIVVIVIALVVGVVLTHFAHSFSRWRRK